MRLRHSSSRCTYVCSTVALRPPNSGGWAGSSQPLSNSSRCQSRAHCGMCDTERGRSSVSAGEGRCSSRNAENSARNCSTSESKVSCIEFLRDHGAMFGGAAQQQFAGLGPLQRELKIVLPGEPHGTERLEAVPEHQGLALPRGGLGHGRRDAPTRVVGGDRERDRKSTRL